MAGSGCGLVWNNIPENAKTPAKTAGVPTGIRFLLPTGRRRCRLQTMATRNYWRRRLPSELCDFFLFVLFRLDLNQIALLWWYLQCVRYQTASIQHTFIAGTITRSPASGAGNISEPRLMSKVARVREIVCAQISILVPVFVCLCSSCNHVTVVGGP